MREPMDNVQATGQASKRWLFELAYNCKRSQLLSEGHVWAVDRVSVMAIVSARLQLETVIDHVIQNMSS